MTDKYNALVFIGRFQPFHDGHAIVIAEALKQAKEVIVLVGSCFAAPSQRNPFTFEERKEMIKAVFPEDNVKVRPILDYPYNENKWISGVQNIVYSSIKWSADPLKIGLIGHSKDSSSYYLNIFKPFGWDAVEVENFDSLNATNLRNAMFMDMWAPNRAENVLRGHRGINPRVQPIIGKIIANNKERFESLSTEFKMVNDYKKAWASAPFPPTFVCTDAVVIQSGHILLIKRGQNPGKGLWALPGGFLNQNETLLDCTIRELKEETRIKIPVPVLYGSVKQQHTFDDPNRSARGRTLTTAFLIDLGFAESLPKVKGSDDAEFAKWFAFKDVQRQVMFEDHHGIIDYFLNIG